VPYARALAFEKVYGILERNCEKENNCALTLEKVYRIFAEILIVNGEVGSFSVISLPITEKLITDLRLMAESFLLLLSFCYTCVKFYLSRS
jgi:hypothetical protein